MRYAFAAALFLAASIVVSAQTRTASCQFENFRLPLPNVYDTAVNAINRNQTMVGMYTQLRKYQGVWEPVGHGFMLRHSQWSLIDVPGRAQTQPFGLNDKDEVVGDSWPGYSGPPQGFLLDAGGYHILNFSGYHDVFPLAINNQSQIVGEMSTNSNRTEGFLFENNNLHVILFPGAAWSYAVGINDAGDIVGSYAFADGSYHGFLLRDGIFTTLDYPGAPQTMLWTINNKGVVVGSYLTPTSSIFFTWQAGEFEELPNDGFYRCQGGLCPNPTAFLSVNDAGVFAGHFYAAGQAHADGFMAQCK